MTSPSRSRRIGGSKIVSDVDNTTEGHTRVDVALIDSVRKGD
ncbi:MAG TPA: hypothetical protein VF148_05020 [Acidimicrobiia bacterium]